MGFFGALSTLIGGAFMGLMTVLVHFFGRQIIVRGIAIAQAIVILGVFIVALRAILVTIVYAAPPWLSESWSWVMPTNFVACFTAIGAAYLARWVYDVTTDMLFKRL